MKSLKIIGLIIILAGLLMNPFILGYLFAEDKNINSFSVLLTIIVVEIFVLFNGICCYIYSPDWISNKRKEIVLVILTLIFLIILFELSLRMYPSILGPDFTNSVLSKYTTQKDGIYYYDENLNMNFMKPNFSIINYYNGYYWQHKTDSLGFRNEKERSTVDIILLGDSYIYGHGVEFNQTVGYFIENLTNFSVANLARQGDSSFQELYILNNYGFKYNPKYVLYFFYENDLIDLYVHKVNFEDVINNSLMNIEFLKHPPKKWSSKSTNFIFNNFVFQKPHIIKAINMLLQRRIINTLKDNVNYSFAWDYTEKAILLMKNLSDRYNSTFIIVPITPYDQEKFKILEKIGQKYNLLVINTTKINNEDSSLFLKNDGHFSENGAKTISELVVKEIENFQ